MNRVTTILLLAITLIAIAINYYFISNYLSNGPAQVPISKDLSNISRVEGVLSSLGINNVSVDGNQKYKLLSKDSSRVIAELWFEFDYINSTNLKVFSSLGLNMVNVEDNKQDKVILPSIFAEFVTRTLDSLGQRYEPDLIDAIYNNQPKESATSDFKYTFKTHKNNKRRNWNLLIVRK